MYSWIPGFELMSRFELAAQYVGNVTKKAFSPSFTVNIWLLTSAQFTNMSIRNAIENCEDYWPQTAWSMNWIIITAYRWRQPYISNSNKYHTARLELKLINDLLSLTFFIICNQAGLINGRLTLSIWQVSSGVAMFENQYRRHPQTFNVRLTLQTFIVDTVTDYLTGCRRRECKSI